MLARLCTPTCPTPRQDNTLLLPKCQRRGRSTIAVLTAKTAAGAGSAAISGIINSANDLIGIEQLVDSELGAVKALRTGLDAAQSIYQRRINDLKNQLNTFESSIAQLACPPPPPPHPIVIVPILIHTPGDPNGISGQPGIPAPAPSGWPVSQRCRTS